jgi:hypothetical protein
LAKTKNACDDEKNKQQIPKRIAPAVAGQPSVLFTEQDNFAQKTNAYTAQAPNHVITESNHIE